MKQQFISFWRDEDGATAVEYALIAGLIAVALIAALDAFGDTLSEFFGYLGDQLPTGDSTAPVGG